MAAIITPPLDVVLAVSNTSATRGTKTARGEYTVRGVTQAKVIGEDFTVLANTAYYHAQPELPAGRTVTNDATATFVAMGSLTIDGTATFINNGELVIL